MTKLGDSLAPDLLAALAPPPLDLDALVASLAPTVYATADGERIALRALGDPASIRASCQAWVEQDDDAHELCTLTACRDPLHPGPCKGWKHTLHLVSPGAYKALEDERVRRLNERRLAKIKDLQTAGKPIPRRLLKPIQPRPVPPKPPGYTPPTPATKLPTHLTNANPKLAPGLPPLKAPPSTKIGQHGELAGGQAHTLGQAANKAAGVVQNTPAPLHHAPNTAGHPGKVTLGQAVKAMPATAPIAAHTPASPPATGHMSLDLQRAHSALHSPHASGQTRVAAYEKIDPAEFAKLDPKVQQQFLRDLRDIRDHGALSDANRASAVLGKLTPAGPHAPAVPSATDKRAKDLQQAIKATQTGNLTPGARMFAYGKLDKQQYDSLPPAAQQQIRADLVTVAHNGSPSQQAAAHKLHEDFTGAKVPAKPSPAAPSAPAAPHPPAPAKVAPAVAARGVTPAAPLPATSSAATKHAAAVANRTAPKAAMAKTHLDAYGKLTHADFQQLDTGTQNRIRDDLANAKAKFLDPKKKDEAQKLLDRFGALKTVPAPAPVPGGAKGYSDPMKAAVDAAKMDDRATALARVGVLSHSSIKDLTPEDRKIIMQRLDSTAASNTLPQLTKDRASAYKRIIENGSPQQTARKWDHEPSIGELHIAEQKAITDAAKAAPKHAAPDTSAADALAAARDALKVQSNRTMTRDQHVDALTRLDKAHFDAMPKPERNLVLAAMLHLHTDQVTNGSGPRMTVRDQKLEDHVTHLTGYHPAIARMKRAEDSFRSGQIDSHELHTEFIHANVAAPSGSGIRPAFEREAARIAKDNPTLETYVRARLAGSPEYGLSTYGAISHAQQRFNWENAPRLSSNDMRDIFRATDADLAKVDPIHAQAVRDLQAHIIQTGLAHNSPWSTATRNQLVDAVLGLEHGRPEVSPEKLKQFYALPDASRTAIRATMRKAIDSTPTDHGKTRLWLAQHAITGGTPLTAHQRDAALSAANPYAYARDLANYRKLPPSEFDQLPGHVQGSILEHLHTEQKRLEAAGQTQTPGADLLGQLPDALAAHLTGTRVEYPTKAATAAADIGTYGRGVFTPESRIFAYNMVPGADFQHLHPMDRQNITNDLGRISNDNRNSLQVRYAAAFTRDVNHQPPSNGGVRSDWSLQQAHAVDYADPAPGMARPDADTVSKFRDLSKDQYDKLDPVYREAIDERIKTLPAGSQAALNAKFHPGSVAQSPVGMNPTTTAPNPRVQDALDVIYGVHPKAHTSARQMVVYGNLKHADFQHLNAQEQNHVLGDLSYIATTSKGPYKARAATLIDRFTPAGTPLGGHAPAPPVIPPVNAVPGQTRYATPLKGTLEWAKDTGQRGDMWVTTPSGQRVWGKYGAAGVLLMHQDPNTGERRYLMVQRGPAISNPGLWQFPGGAIESKESFHQGAARETIEELGFKKDALKDAQVHGEHAYTIPGHSWKYVSIAAQVPTMLKPDLSAPGALAETSDAKWMTADEIRALDKSGKLMGPLAGGKLEQNIMSLYPSHSGGTPLAQAARPAPRTTKLKRLVMPSGGRQAPSAFNAHTAPHKPSKGKDLLTDKAAIDQLRQDVKHARAKWDGKTADGRLAAIGEMQGFHDTPTVVSKSEMDRLLATGDYIEAWRGVSRSGYGSNSKSAHDINEEFRSGPAYYGRGIFGNGYYLATQKSVAEKYSDHSKGSVVRILIPKSALTVSYEDAKRESAKIASPTSKAKGRYEDGTLYDPGRWAAAKGHDGIEIQHNASARGGGWSRHVAAPGKPAYNWLNRSVLIVQEA